MVTELFLIAHKVRGEPAFDVALKMDMNDGNDWWIIPTSGHRAYPYWASPLEGPMPEMPDDLPDHYETIADKGRGSGTNGRDLLERIGLVSAREPMTRRSF